MTVKTVAAVGINNFLGSFEWIIAKSMSTNRRAAVNVSAIVENMAKKEAALIGADNGEKIHGKRAKPAKTIQIGNFLMCSRREQTAENGINAAKNSRRANAAYGKVQMPNNKYKKPNAPSARNVCGRKSNVRFRIAANTKRRKAAAESMEPIKRNKSSRFTVVWRAEFSPTSGREEN